MRYAIGLDVGGTKIAAGIVNEKGDLIQKEVVKSDPSDKERMFLQVITCVKELLNHSSIPANEIYGIGAGIPGKIDRKNGIAVFQNNLPWENFPFIKRMQEELQIERVVIDNDVHMAAFAEWKKANLTNKNLFVYITISTGISCAIIHNGEFIRGAGFAGELGLIPVYAKGYKQPVERLEWLASGPAVQSRAREVFMDESLTSEAIFSSFNSGDATKRQLIDEMVTSLTHGVYIINSLLDPHKIVFGGSIAIHNPYLLNLVTDKLEDYLIEEQKHILNGMEISRLDNEQGVIGAGLRVFDSVPDGG